jgi:hypothetical protein
MIDYITLIDLGISFLESFLSGLKNKLPAEVVAAVQAAVDALAAHKADALTKANFESQRG